MPLTQGFLDGVKIGKTLPNVKQGCRIYTGKGWAIGLIYIEQTSLRVLQVSVVRPG